MGKLGQYLTELSARNISVFSFLDNNFSKYQWIFTKLGMCIYFVEIRFGIANGQSSSIFTVLSARHRSIFSFLDDNFCKYQ